MSSTPYAPRLTVGIAAHAGPGGTGGVARFIGSLIHALGKLDDGPEKYLIVVRSEAHRAWLQPLLGPNQEIVFEGEIAREVERRNRQDTGRSAIGWLKLALGPLLPAARALQRLINLPRQWPEVPLSDGSYEALGCDVLHIANQPFFLCSIPTVYNPHDLQHLHLPQFFSPEIIAWRETIFPAGCHFAHTVVVGSQWVKDDVVKRYRVDPDKIQVIFEAATTESLPEPSEHLLETIKAKYQIEGPFALYPAMTWPHKNHLRLLEALALLRDTRGLVVPLICTGARRKDVWPTIERRLRELQLSPQVRFLDLLPEEDLKALFHLAQFLVLPTLLEAIALPIFEAWLASLPVACSNVTALPEQVRDAALMFDPTSIESIADALARMATDSELRSDLRRRGYARIKDFTWDRTAKAYRAVYRRAAGFPLTEEDRWLLSWDWAQRPEKERQTPTAETP
jgi:glycosyltransferase involved in cell wall biosynthesis